MGLRTATQRRVSDAVSGSDGAFVLCRLPLDVPLLLEVDAAGARAGPMYVEGSTVRLRRVDVASAQPTTAGLNHRAFSNPVTDSVMSPARAIFRGKVVRDHGKPVQSGVVSILGSSQRSNIDETGTFRIAGVEPGSRTVEVRAIGSAVTRLTVDLASNAVYDTTILIRPAVPRLGIVEIRDARQPVSFAIPLYLRDGFLARRRMGLGAFLSDSQVTSVTYSDLESLLAAVRGVTTTVKKDGSRIPVLRGMTSPKCVPNFYVDGVACIVEEPVRPYSVLRTPYSVLRDAVHPSSVKAIEVYSSAGGSPLQFDLTSSTGCGSIAIWTR